MALRFTGNQTMGDDFEHVLETFHGDLRVSVFVSNEAMDDHGLNAVQQKASEKYDGGKVRSARAVEVRTTDF